MKRRAGTAASVSFAGALALCLGLGYAWPTPSFGGDDDAPPTCNPGEVLTRMDHNDGGALGSGSDLLTRTSYVCRSQNTVPLPAAEGMGYSVHAPGSNDTHVVRQEAVSSALSISTAALGGFGPNGGILAIAASHAITRPLAVTPANQPGEEGDTCARHDLASGQPSLPPALPAPANPPANANPGNGPQPVRAPANDGGNQVPTTVKTGTGSAGPVWVPPPSNALLPPSTPGAQPAGDVAHTVGQAAQIADLARGTQIADAAEEARHAVLRAASDDQRTLAEPYRQLPTEALGGYLSRARDALGSAADVLDTSSGGPMESGEKARFRDYFLNARDKASLGLDAIAEDRQRKEAMGESSPFANLLGPDDNPLARSASLAEIFGAKLPSDGAAATADSLVNRLVMFNGLPPDQQAAMLANLKLVEKPTFTTPSGNSVTIPILHNGYILGGGATAMDCSSFVSAALPVDVRKGRFTTLDFYAMWKYRHDGRMPLPPSYPESRSKLIQQVADAFTPLDVYVGDRLTVGDLLVYRIPSMPVGHVFIVKSYNPANMEAEVIEAAQSASTVRERDFPLSLDPPTEPNRMIRTGLFGLRLRPVSNKGCRYRDHGGAQPGEKFNRPSTDDRGTTGGATF